MNTRALGLKARHVTAWAEASPTSAGPGHASLKISPGLKGRNNSPPAFCLPHLVPPLQGGGILWADFFLGLHPRLSHRGPPALNTRAPGLKARHVTAWAEASPTSAGPGHTSPPTTLAL